ncbi:MAG: UPF0262 family protein [Pseudomonadota bacterium]|nr:UPF0262 family protein [Pseudomonadota bacterium]
MTEPPATTQRIANVTLDERTVVRRSTDIEHERRVAIFDLLEDNSFAPDGLDSGPYHLHLAIEDNRLAMHINDTDDQPLERVMVPVSPYRRLIKDYFTVCESYFEAIKRSAPSQIEAIDMGRRALHNEGSDLLREQLADKVAIDDDTARRLFTLLCVLHIRA